MKIKPEIYVLYENGVVIMCTTSRRRLRHVLCKKLKSGELAFKNNNGVPPCRRIKDLLKAVTYVEFSNGRFKTVNNKVEHPDFYQNKEIFVVYVDETPICFTTDVLVGVDAICNKIEEGVATFLPELESDPIEQSKMFRVAIAMEDTQEVLLQLDGVKYDILDNGKLYKTTL